MALTFKRSFRTSVPANLPGLVNHTQQLTDDLASYIDKGPSIAGGGMPFEYKSVTISPNSSLIITSTMLSLRGGIIIESGGIPVTSYSFSRTDNGLQFSVGDLPSQLTITLLLVGDRR